MTRPSCSCLRCDPAPGRHAGRAGPAALLARAAPAILLVAACATTGSTREPIQLHGEYVFTGTVQGVAVDGSLAFHDDGGYTVNSSRGTCDVRPPLRRPVDHVENASFTARCENLRLVIPVVDGELADRATARVGVREEYEAPGPCLAYNEEGVCIRRGTVTRTRIVTLTGVVRVERR